MRPRQVQGEEGAGVATARPRAAPAPAQPPLARCRTPPAARFSTRAGRGRGATLASLAGTASTPCSRTGTAGVDTFAGLDTLVRNLGLDELRQESERLLPAETARLGWDRSRQALLHDSQLGSAGDLLQGDRRFHLARQARIVEPVRVANAFVWHQFQIFTA